MERRLCRYWLCFCFETIFLQHLLHRTFRFSCPALTESLCVVIPEGAAILAKGDQSSSLQIQFALAEGLFWTHVTPEPGRFGRVFAAYQKSFGIQVQAPNPNGLEDLRDPLESWFWRKEGREETCSLSCSHFESKLGIAAGFADSFRWETEAV